jgi:hypothetical protein
MMHVQVLRGRRALAVLAGVLLTAALASSLIAAQAQAAGGVPVAVEYQGTYT